MAYTRRAGYENPPKTKQTSSPPQTLARQGNQQFREGDLAREETVGQRSSKKGKQGVTKRKTRFTGIRRSTKSSGQCVAGQVH